ncbi:hypothetical protein C8R46DRAFT_1114089, partial [Mycena filopes]
MQFTLKSAFVALAAALAGAAAPAGPSTDSALVDGHVFICTDINFGGDCTNYGFFNNVCSTFTGEFQDDISSFGPDKGWSCTLYTNTLQRPHLHGGQPRVRNAPCGPQRRVQLCALRARL